MVTRLHGSTAALVAGMAVALAFPVSSAHAQQAVIYVQTAPPENMRIERVSYWDLNLASQAGEQTLHRRVGRAVEHVCLYDQGRWYGLSEPAYNHCAWESWRRARPQMVGAVYRARMAAYGHGY